MRAPRRRKDEAMFSVKTLLPAAAAVMISTAAFGADLPMPQPVYQPVVAEPCCANAWYLRGFVGVGIMNRTSFDFERNPGNGPTDFKIQHNAIDDTTFFGIGVGYEFNNWFRADVTAEYRTKAAINAFGLFTNPQGSANVFGDQFTGSIHSTVVLANGYIDLGTWNCLTPFIGAGVGVAFNTFSDLVDTGIAESGSGMGHNPTEAHLAWALHAGLSYAVTQNFTMELAYRYLNYGSVKDSINCIGGAAVGCGFADSFKVDNLSSNDIMLGFRWRFPPSTGIVVPPPAISTRG
jgi:opacity protein-like surface antigen